MPARIQGDEVIMSNPYYACYPNFVEYLRFSYANSMENIREGLERIERYLKK